MTKPTITIDQRFCGPPTTGNGGYVSGMLARHVDAPTVSVRLRRPPPLNQPLEVRRGGNAVLLYHGEETIAEGRPGVIELVLPGAPGFEEAVQASSRYVGFISHHFPSCFVCGPNREPGDGLRIFAGLAESRGLVAAPWIPHESLASDAVTVDSEFLWAALDCPGAFSFEATGNHAVVLGELTVTLLGQVGVGERCVLVGWEVERDGRKHHTGTALFGESGECCGMGLGTWFELTP